MWLILICNHLLGNSPECFFLSVDSTANVPKFSWSQEGCSRDGIAHLNVIFPDSDITDIAILSPANPIPRQAEELDQDVDNCIFTGFLRDEPDSVITLTGGCPFEDSYEVIFISVLLQWHVISSWLLYRHHHNFMNNSVGIVPWL